MVLADFEDFLEDISEAFRSDDYDLWRSRIRVPLCLDLSTGLKIIKSECEARRYFHDCQIIMRIQRIDAIIRNSLEFEECDDGVVLATYETHLFSGSHRVCEPFRSTAMLRRTNGTLKAGSILNCLEFHVGSKPQLARIANLDRLPDIRRSLQH